MSSVDSFSYGKRGRRLSPEEALVRRLITWHAKTLTAALSNHGVDPSQFTTRKAMIIELAFQILKRQSEGRPAR